MATADRYATMTQDQFDNILRDLASKDGTDALLDIPGVWDAVSEHYNNDVLEAWEQDHPTEPCEECDNDDATWYESVPGSPAGAFLCAECKARYDNGPREGDLIFDPEYTGQSLQPACMTVGEVQGQDPDDDQVWIVNNGVRIVWEDSAWMLAYDKQEQAE